MGRLPGLSVFLPAHNEEGNIARVVTDFLRELPNLADVYEIIVVNDGSRDQTGAIADRLAAENPRVKVVHHEVNRGYGGAFDPADVQRLAARTPEYDVVVGHRTHRADALIRRINGKAWTILVRLMFGLRISDMDCGFKLFRRALLENMELHARGAMITTELMARLAGRKARICEVDVKHLPRLAGEQSGANFKVIARAFKELFALYRELKAAREGEPGAAARP